MPGQAMQGGTDDSAPALHQNPDLAHGDLCLRAWQVAFEASLILKHKPCTLSLLAKSAMTEPV